MVRVVEVSLLRADLKDFKDFKVLKVARPWNSP
jgi:hypothetical protein